MSEEYEIKYSAKEAGYLRLLMNMTIQLCGMILSKLMMKL
jgi:hypothetical protein